MQTGVCVIILPEEAGGEQLQAGSNICQSRQTHVLSLLCLAVEVCVSGPDCAKKVHGCLHAHKCDPEEKATAWL